VLLGEIADRAGRSYGWPRLHVEVTPGASLSSAVAAAAAKLVAVFAEDPPKGRLRATSAVVGAMPGVRAEVTLSRGDTSAAVGGGHAIDEALARAVDAARARQCGFLVTLDEMQLAAREELAALAAALQAGIDADWPVVMVGAGLAGMRDPGRAVSYFERAEWHEIGSLNPTQTRQALEEPAAEAGRPFDDDALELLVCHSGGYPYAVQLYGHHAWRAATGRDRIELAAATQGAASATKQLEVGLYANRWTQASPAERRYLTALAGLLAQRPSVGGADVAAELGVTTRQVSYLRDRLIKKGTITVEGHRLGFAIPGLAQYIQRQGHQIGSSAPGDASPSPDTTPGSAGPGDPPSRSRRTWASDLGRTLTARKW
jgi:hypothetical protein